TEEYGMKVAALVVLSVLVALPAEAAQRRQNSVSASCDNDGRCTTLNAVSASSKASSFRAHRSSHQAVDANGNGIMVTVQTAYACKFQKFYALLKEHGYKVDPRINKCYARGGHVSGSNHYIGAACDNQYGWNKAPAYMYHVGDLIRQAGLYDGCRFGDCGHVEAVRVTHKGAPK